MKFEEFPFVAQLRQAITEIGFVDCTPVQEQSFQAYFSGKDIYAQSQTGTGKTAAFMLCGIQELIKRNRECLSPNEGGEPLVAESEDSETPEVTASEFAGTIKMLILSPTRELAEQIEQEAKLLGQFLPLQIAAFYGGVGYEEQRAHLDSGVQIITGTPGRIIDLAKSGQLPLEQVQVMVLDEADRMLDMGFIDDVRWVMGRVPEPAQRLTMLFSATLNAKVGNLTWEFMRANQVAEIIIEPEQVTTENIEQELYHVSNQEKLRLLLSLIQKHDPESAIIFCNTKSGASFLEGRLRSNGYQVKALMGDLPQSKRTQVLGQLKAGKLRFVVATDVASRGLHIEGLPLVINYDLPDEAENYVHRIGRTARAGASGRAISLACERYVYNLAAIESFMDSKIPASWFAEEDLVEDKSGGRNAGQRSYTRGATDRNPKQRSDRAQGRNKRTDRGGRQDQGSGDKQKDRISNSSQDSGSNKQGKRPSRIPSDKEKRLQYYQEKYGENFGAERSLEAAGTAKQDRSQNSKGRRIDSRKQGVGAGGSGTSRGKNQASGKNSGHRQSTGKNTRKNVQKRVAPQSGKAEKQKTQAPAASPQKKSGFLQRLFGKK